MELFIPALGAFLITLRAYFKERKRARLAATAINHYSVLFKRVLPHINDAPTLGILESLREISKLANEFNK